MVITGRGGERLKNDAAFELWQDMTSVQHDGGCVYLCGNGASASIASHFATDLAKNGKIPTRIFTDLSLVTAIGNDISYDEVFAEPLRWHARSDELLVAISSSGNSPNVVNAIIAANQIGCRSVTLSSFSQENKIRQLGDINIYIPSSTYGLAETAHAAIMHYWMDAMEARAKQQYG